MKRDEQIIEQWKEHQFFTEEFIADHWNQFTIRHKESCLFSHDPENSNKQWNELTDLQKNVARPRVLDDLIIYVKILISQS